MPDTVEVNRYGDSGNILQQTSDDDADGIVDALTDYEYDDSGRWTTIRRYSGERQVLVRQETLAYNSDGRLAKWSVDADVDGAPDILTAYAYDLQGRLHLESLDADADGHPDKITWYAYYPNGSLKQVSKDTDADGNANIVDDFYWRGSLLVRRETYVEGELYLVVSYFYNEDGGLLRREEDSNGDGEPETIWLYYGEDRFSRTVRVRDGVIDYEATIGLDELGRIVRMTIHDMAHGLYRVSDYSIVCTNQ